MQMNVGRNAEIIKTGTAVVATIYPIEDTDQVLFLIDGIMYDDGTEEKCNRNITFSKFNCPDLEEHEVVKVVNNIKMVPYEEMIEKEYMKHFDVCTKEEIKVLIGSKEEYYTNPNYTDDMSIEKIPQKTNKIMIKF